MLTKPSSIPKGLPKKVTSLCPDCGKLIPALLKDVDGKVIMEKRCQQHGDFTDIVWSDSEQYLRAEKWAKDGIGVENPAIKGAKNCPFECGLCDLHLSHTALANVDLTNRCNLKCPICFANANSAGYVYEPDYETVVKMLKMLRAQRPVPTPAVQFSGGEPTIHPRFIDIIQAAHDLKFSQVQVATNGIRFANEPELLQAAAKAGLNTIYLQFDGMRESDYIAARGKALLKTKLKVAENLRKIENRPSIVLVPTLVKTINDDQIWPMVEYALSNLDVIRGINFQPVAFSGRIDQKKRLQERYTISDLMADLEKQSKGQIKKSDWYPPPAVAVFSELVGAILEKRFVTFTTHPNCGMATYMFIDKKTREITPLPRFIDVESLFVDLEKLVSKTEKRTFKKLSALTALKLIDKHMDESKTPEGMNKTNLLKMLKALLKDDTKKGLAKFSWDMLYMGAMHFQDSYNYDVDRVMRCGIHYTTPDGKIIPFCAYNSGPVYRTEIEKKFSVPLDQWRKQKGEEFT